jgi:hypothetical protein
LFFTRANRLTLLSGKLGVWSRAPAIVFAREPASCCNLFF